MLDRDKYLAAVRNFPDVARFLNNIAVIRAEIQLRETSQWPGAPRGRSGIGTRDCITSCNQGSKVVCTSSCHRLVVR